MRIHFLNCVSTCPLGGALMDGRSGASLRGRLMEKDRRARLANQARLRNLRRDSSQVQLFCAHDGVEFERLTRRPAPERRATPFKEIPWRNRTWQARSS